MLGITIETPSESTALAGLLEPGDRIDLLLTLNDLRSTGRSALDSGADQVPSETLIKNIEILAVDTKLEAIEGDDQKKMSNSVTLLVKSDMAHDIIRAKQLGTLTLVLRGNDAGGGPDPQTAMTMDEFISRHMSVAKVGVDNRIAATTEYTIRTLRGGSVQEIPVIIANGKN